VIIEYFIYKLAKHYKIPIKKVFKKRKKQQSKKLDQFSRFREINTNITLNSPKCMSLKSNDKILIFDDLWTTGATMNHLCKLLVDDGIMPEQIDCMVLFIRPKTSLSFYQ
jgi:predicted amidophosphoribosyltransferase